jgi:transposase
LLTEEWVVLYEDESHIRSYQALRSTWAEKGKQKQVATYGHHAYVSLFGAVNVLNGEFLCQSFEACHAEHFLCFLQGIVAHYPDQQILLVLDNAKIHRAKLLNSFLQEHQDRLFLLFLPPYSPNLNPVERIWKWLKDSVIANRFHKTKQDIQQSVNAFLSFVQKAQDQVLQRVGYAPQMSKR